MNGSGRPIRGDAWDFIRLGEGDPNRLSATDLTQVRAGIHKARRLNFLISVNAKEQLDRIKSLGVPDPAHIDPAEQRECEAIARS